MFTPAPSPGAKPERPGRRGIDNQQNAIQVVNAHQAEAFFEQLAVKALILRMASCARLRSTASDSSSAILRRVSASSAASVVSVEFISPCRRLLEKSAGFLLL